MNQLHRFSDEDPELWALVEAYCDRRATPAQRDALDARLAADPEARRFYLGYAQLHADLAWKHRGTSDLAPALTKASTPVLGFLGSATAVLNRPVFWSIFGVGILFAGYFAVISWNMFSRENGGPRLQAEADRSDSELPPTVSNLPPEAVATITASDAAEWSQDSEIAPFNPRPRPGAKWSDSRSTITPGQPLSLQTGLVELRLKQGTTLIVEGPAEWKINGENSATLTRGKLVARVPQKAIGFTLNTPTAKIVDLGTEFGAAVERDGSSTVTVLDGKVETYSNAAGGKSVQLFAGQAVRLVRNSPRPETIPFDAQAFANISRRQTDGSRRNRPILLFRDNFDVVRPSDDINPGPNDRPGRQSGLLAPLKYVEREGKAATTTQLGQPLARNGLLLSGDAQQRTCVAPEVEFRPKTLGRASYSIEFLVSPGRSVTDLQEPTRFWAGVLFGMNEPIATIAGSTSGVGFLVRGNGGYQLWDCTSGKPQLAREGALGDALAGNDVSGWCKLRFDYDVPAFDEKSRSVVNITVNDRPLTQYTTAAGFQHNFVVLDGESLQGVCHAFDDFKVSCEELSSVE